MKTFLKVSFIVTLITFFIVICPQHVEAVRRTPSYAIHIEVRHPTLRVYRDGVRIHTYPVALGTTDTETPIGRWTVVQKQMNWGGGFGTRWIGLNVPWGTYGIHGTNRPWTIGTYASHGCIRMRNEDIEQLYEEIPMGTPVVITGDPIQSRRTIKHGDIGADVQWAQQKLKRFGFFRGDCDGRYGDGTQWAVMMYQLRVGLPMDGAVTSDDYESLHSIDDAKHPLSK